MNTVYIYIFIYYLQTTMRKPPYSRQEGMEKVRCGVCLTSVTRRNYRRHLRGSAHKDLDESERCRLLNAIKGRSRERRPCPVPGCHRHPVHLSVHLQSGHHNIKKGTVIYHQYLNQHKKFVVPELPSSVPAAEPQATSSARLLKIETGK